MMKSGPIPLAIFILGLTLGVGLCFAADHPQPLSGPFATPLTDATVDYASVAEWVDGSERPLVNPNALRQVIWTQSFASASGLLNYGASAHNGPRSLRIGFQSPVAIGSIL